MSKLAIGDVIEIKTSKGLAYAHYTHRHKQYGALLRVFNRIYPERPKDFAKAVSGEPSFLCFFPLGAAIKRHIVSVVGNVSLPDEVKPFPIFRAGIVDPSTGKVKLWWLWDGETERRVDSLSPELRKLPIRGVWNDTLLIERIISGWTPETDPT